MGGQMLLDFSKRPGQRKQSFPLRIAQLAFEPLEQAFHGPVFGAELVSGWEAHVIWNLRKRSG
jgi:hypothetical protein